MTKRQHDFCIAYIKTRNPREACMSVGYSVAYSKSKSYLLLKNPEIKEKIDHLSETYYKNQFQELALKSIKKLSDVIEDDESRTTQLNGIKYVLGVVGVADKDTDTGVIEIKVKLPHGLSD